VITFNAIQKTEKDSVLFTTYSSGNAVKIQVTPSQNIGDLMDIFPLLAAKDSAIVKIPADSVFKGHEEQRPPFLPKGSYMVFSLKIEKVQTVEDAIAERNAAMEKFKVAEAGAIDKYIADKKMTLITTASGLKYIITQPSIKPKPMKGDSVFVNYVGHTVEGKVFDTSIEAVAKASGMFNPGRPYEPIAFVVGTSAVIKGWDEGLLLLNEGAKATFVIPSALAYGQQGSGEMIKPFTPLVFELELVRVKHAKHAPAKKLVKKAVHAKKAPVKKK
jgi:FKBP-type peptidyl-prolyl cis-trans isomerase FkpA